MSIIEVKNLYKTFDDRVIFKDFSLRVEQGEMLAITGESGCGKTTLLNIIGLLEPFDAGNVCIDGNCNVKVNSRKAGKILRETISYLFQNFALVEDETVKYNLLLALKYCKFNVQEKARIIYNALDAVGLCGFENKKIFHLSGGEQQRVAIARCILKPSKIILADEPTGSVDPQNREVILNLIQEMNRQGKTVVIVTHDPYVANKSSRQIHLPHAGNMSTH